MYVFKTKLKLKRETFLEIIKASLKWELLILVNETLMGLLETSIWDDQIIDQTSRQKDVNHLLLPIKVMVLWKK